MEQQIQDATSAPKVKLPGIIALIKETVEIYKQKYPTLLKIAAFYFLPNIIALALIAVYTRNGGMAGLIVAGMLLYIWLIPSSFLFLWYWIMGTIVLRDAKENIGFSAALQRSIPFIIPCIVAGLTAWLIVVAGLPLLIPAIIFSMWFSFYLYTIVIDGERGLSALQKSKLYIKGKILDVFFRLLLFTITIWLIQSITSSVLGLIKIKQITDVLVGFLLSPLSLIFYFVIFDHLKKAKGEVSFAASAKEKNTFAVLVGIGLILIFIVVGLTIYFWPQVIKWLF